MSSINRIISSGFSHFKKKAILFGAYTLSAVLAAGSLFALPSSALQVLAAATDSSASAVVAQPPTVDINTVAQWPTGPSVSAEAAILMEAGTGTILYSKNIHDQHYPASCTKILTCLIASEECAMDELVYMSNDAVYDTPRGSNHIALDVGEAITMEQALSAILIRSANEVSFAVGEHISGGSWEDFGPIMTQKAKDLGCLNSNFINPNGLPDENHYTTAYDLATIARYFFDNELLAKLSRTTKLEIPATDLQPDNIVEHTKNRLLPGQKYAYEYLVGSKTGYTDVARNCLVSCAEKNGLKLICVVLKDSSPEHYTDTIALFDYGFENFTTVNVAENETKYNLENSLPFQSGSNMFGDSQPLLVLNDQDFIILPNTAAFSETQTTLSYDNTQKGQAAVITYSWHGVPVGTASIDYTGTDMDYTSLFPMSTEKEENATEDSTTDHDSADKDTDPGDKNTDSTDNHADPGDKEHTYSGKFVSVLLSILKIFLILLGILAVAALLWFLFLRIRNYRKFARRSRYRRRAGQEVPAYRPHTLEQKASPSILDTFKDNMARRRRYYARKARKRRERKNR